DCQKTASADDILIIVQGRKIDDVMIHAQRILDFTARWADHHKLSFNPTKRKLMLTGRVLDLNAISPLVLSGKQLEFVCEYKYLGVILDKKLKWKSHTNFISEKCEKMLVGLCRVARNSFEMNYYVLKLIYQQSNATFITYGSHAWGKSLSKINQRHLRKIQRRILLRIVKGYKTLSYEAVLVLAGVSPIDLEIQRRNKASFSFERPSPDMTNGRLPLCDIPHPALLQPIQIIKYESNIPNNFTESCFTDGSKMNSKVGLALVVYEDDHEACVQQFRIRNDCTVFQAELLRINLAVVIVVDGPGDQQSYIRFMSLCTLKKSKVSRGLGTRSCLESPRHARI
ncbi:hypothetical protein AVEN_274863-1, partial [Araneus ventricosus]